MLCQLTNDNSSKYKFLHSGSYPEYSSYGIILLHIIQKQHLRYTKLNLTDHANQIRIRKENWSEISFCSICFVFSINRDRPMQSSYLRFPMYFQHFANVAERIIHFECTLRQHTNWASEFEISSSKMIFALQIFFFSSSSATTSHGRAKKKNILCVRESLNYGLQTICWKTHVHSLVQ